MHTAVLALGIVLILSELGAIGFMLINTIRHVTEPKAAVHLVSDKKAASRKKTVKVTIIENEKATTTVIADPEEKHPTKGKLQAGYFSLVP